MKLKYCFLSTNLVILLSLLSFPLYSQDTIDNWDEAFTPEHRQHLKDREIELPSGKKGVKEKQLNDFLNDTQLEMLRTRKAELQYQEQTPEEVYEKYQYITPKMAVAHVKKAIAHIEKVGIKQAIVDFNKFPSKWYKGRKV